MRERKDIENDIYQGNISDEAATREILFDIRDLLSDKKVNTVLNIQIRNDDGEKMTGKVITKKVAEEIARRVPAAGMAKFTNRQPF
jgi:hypothetical protein